MKRVSSTSKVVEETVARGYVAPRLRGELTELASALGGGARLGGYGGGWVGGGEASPTPADLKPGPVTRFPPQPRLNVPHASFRTAALPR